MNAPTSGNKVWFNQIVAAFTGWKDSRNDPEKAVTLGNGEFLDKESVLLAESIMKEN